MKSSILSRIGLARKDQRAWALYDWANSAFATTIMAAVLPPYFHDVAANNIEPHLRTAYWGYITAFSLLIVAITAPVLGTIADHYGKKKTFLGICTVFGCIGSAALFWAEAGNWIYTAVAFFIGNVAWAACLIFYDALLPDVAKKDEVDRVSTAGYAVGYIGGGILLAINLLWILKPELFGIPDSGFAVRLSFLSVAFWWAIFSLPLFRKVTEQKQPIAVKNLSITKVAYTRLRYTFKELRMFKQMLIFLCAYWFYSDGIGTIMKMATIYGREVGIGTNHLIGALLLVQFVGIPATFAFGALMNKMSAKTGIMITLCVYTLVCVVGYYMSTAWHFWALAGMVALVQGASQALSRSLFSTLVPKQRTTEFFSFFSVFNRFAGILGPFLFGILAQATGQSRMSILFLSVIFIVGMILLAKVNVEEGDSQAREAELRYKAL